MTDVTGRDRDGQKRERGAGGRRTAVTLRRPQCQQRPTGLLVRSDSMPIEWAGLGPELLLALDRSRPEPLRSQLELQLREAIRSGRLAAGERLPSSRALAAELGLSRGLVLECYSQLQAEGSLTARTGAATRGAEGASGRPASGRPARPPAPATAPEPTGPIPSARLAVD